MRGHVRPPFLEIDLFFRKVRQVKRHAKISRIFHYKGWGGRVAATLYRVKKAKEKLYFRFVNCSLSQGT